MAQPMGRGPQVVRGGRYSDSWTKDEDDRKLEEKKEHRKRTTEWQKQVVKN
jgi:hypothetical protein